MFAKIYETEEYGQILVYKEYNVDTEKHTVVIRGEKDTDLGEMKLVFGMADREGCELVFTQIDRERAFGMVKDVYLRFNIDDGGE